MTNLDTLRAALCIYHGVCAGLAVLTEGILVAPLEGVVSCRIMANDDGTQCLAVNFAGPIRSAGGTGQALSVLIADMLRRDFKLGVPKLTFGEVERYKEEVSLYRGLQYRPSNPELEIIAKSCPIFIDGEGVGKEVTGQRDLDRVKDNKVREGALLVMCEGLVLKAPKILKYVTQLELDGWDWLNQFVKTKNSDGSIKPNPKYMAEVLAGRPIFSMDDNAFNYNSEANKDDGNCEYDPGDCDPDWRWIDVDIKDADNDGSGYNNDLEIRMVFKDWNECGHHMEGHFSIRIIYEESGEEWHEYQIDDTFHNEYTIDDEHWNLPAGEYVIRVDYHFHDSFWEGPSTHYQ